MEKLLIMCEGPNEKEIINILFSYGCLKFTEDDLLGLTPYHARQIKPSAQVRTGLNIYPGKVRELRIGDKQSDKLVIPTEYKDKFKLIQCFSHISFRKEAAFLQPLKYYLCQFVFANSKCFFGRISIDYDIFRKDINRF